MEQGEYGQPPQVPRVEIISLGITESIEESHWTYQDVLWLGLAGLPEGVNRLTANPTRWCEVVAQLKDQTRELAPELLAEVHFGRLGGSVHSYEVARFLAILTPVHWRPWDNTFDISEETKEYAREERQAKLVEYEEAIQLMSQQFQSLVVTP